MYTKCPYRSLTKNAFTIIVSVCNTLYSYDYLKKKMIRSWSSASQEVLLCLFVVHMFSANGVFTVILKNANLQYHHFRTSDTRGQQVKRIRMSDSHFVCLKGKAFFLKEEITLVCQTDIAVALIHRLYRYLQHTGITWCIFYIVTWHYSEVGKDNFFTFFRPLN